MLQKNICGIFWWNRQIGGIEFNEESAYYYRFITHLKFFAQRLLEDKKQNQQEDDLLDVVQTKYANAYKCVEKIAMYIKKTI